MALRNQGRNPRSTSWLAHEMLGYNYRLSDINCALGIVQLSRIEEIKAKRKKAANLYLEALADEDRITLPANPENVDMSWFVFVVRLKGEYSDTSVRDNILNCLREKGIACSNYFTPVHLQPFIAEKYGFKAGDFPVTDDVCKRTVALPFHNHLSEDDVQLVCESLRECLDKFC
jgi:perosamine synthetase